MKNIIEKKMDLEILLRNSIWENQEYGLTYKFQNESDLWINGNAHFNYKIDIENEKLILKCFPNGKNYFIELKYEQTISLHDYKDNFELKFYAFVGLQF